MIRFLSGVDPAGVQPEITLVLPIAEAVWRQYGTETLWVTSIKDGTHKVDSKHYEGLAVDLRVRNLSRSVWELATALLQAAIGPKYDVLLELNPPHVHVEFDPKPLTG